MQPMGYAAGPGPGPMPMMQAQAAGAPYEFSEGENAVIASTARFARIWGIFSLIGGILMLILGLVVVLALGAALAAAPASSGSPFKPAMVVAMGVGLLPSAAVSIIGGIFYIMSAGSLQRVVTTQGNDIPQMMDAVRSLSRAFMIEAIALIVAFVIGLVLGIVMQAGGT